MSLRRPVRVHGGSTPWIVERGSSESAELTLQYHAVRGAQIESCVERVEVAESPERVRIAVIQTIRRGRPPGSWVEGPEWVKVQLDAPLRSRTLLHAPVAPMFAHLQPTVVPPHHYGDT